LAWPKASAGAGRRGPADAFGQANLQVAGRIPALYFWGRRNSPAPTAAFIDRHAERMAQREFF